MTKTMDPELAAALDLRSGALVAEIDLNDIPLTRQTLEEFAKAQVANGASVEGVTSVDRHLPSADGAPDVFVRIYEPTERPATLPILVWMHGGGFVLGSVERDDQLARHLSKVAQCVVVSVEYRLAPEHPAPAPLSDCYTALKWVAVNCDELGADRGKIAIGGASAGAGLAACLALFARDQGEVDLHFQLLVYPMLDDRNIAPAGPNHPDTHVWSRESNRLGWTAYLGHEPGGATVSPYAAAARASDLAGLPPAYISVGDLDLFLDENVHYAQRLLASDVPTELHVYPGAFHGFNGRVPNAEISRRFNRDRDEVLKRMLHR
ncbi:MAG: alpha/beta hydrolase [Gammaproteobacteria bacterium]|nr:alpha/beta hydrolase [Gammaproteobacteria bacterium]